MTAKPKPAKCPICRKPVEPEYRPFCSRHCADVDLQRWFTGRYAVPGAKVDETSEDADGED
jgi:endogenous inhibitor of DNA gyrase (YacG/DUF329 family)